LDKRAIDIRSFERHVVKKGVTNWKNYERSEHDQPATALNAAESRIRCRTSILEVSLNVRIRPSSKSLTY